MSLKGWLSRRFRRREPVCCEVDEHGAHLRDGARMVLSVSWTDVHGIETYKLDQWTTDTICLDFLDERGDVLLSIREETPGFGDLANQLTTFFPKIADDWIRRVTLPPFATNHAVLFTRKQDPGV